MYQDSYNVPREVADAIITAFAHHAPECWAAIDEEVTMVGFEWNWPERGPTKGAKLWVDIHNDGRVTILWKLPEPKG